MSKMSSINTKFVNSKKQGDWGLGRAIAYFTLHEYTVSIPLTESQDYDLVVDYGEGLKKVQVRTTSEITKSGKPTVNLRTLGGNRSYHTAKKFDSSKVDLLYVTTVDFGDYVIPTNKFTSKTYLTIDKRFYNYKIELNGSVV